MEARALQPERRPAASYAANQNQRPGRIMTDAQSLLVTERQLWPLKPDFRPPFTTKYR